MEEDPFYDSIAHQEKVRQAEIARRKQMVSKQLVRLVELANSCGREFREQLSTQLEEQLEQKPFDPEKVMQIHYTEYFN